MIKFLKYYWDNVLKNWFFLLSLIPVFVEKINQLINFYSGIEVGIIKKISELPFFIKIFIPLIIFYILHIKSLYKLWNKKEEPISAGLSYDYNFILEKISRLKPEILEEVNKLFNLGYKCLKDLDHTDIETAIQTHFNAYRIIIEYFENPNLPKTMEVSKFYSILKRNFNKLKEYNDTIGKNFTLSITEHDIRKLINDINDNLKTIFSYF